MHLCNDKALCKKILCFHHVQVPQFHTFYKGQKVKWPKTFKLPCIVKPLTEEASRGISLASIVDNKTSLVKRVQMIHGGMGLDAICEEYIEGRELYVSVIGDKQLRVLPTRELKFGKLPKHEPRIATYKSKWDEHYRKRWGIRNVFAAGLDNGLGQQIDEVCRKAYRALNIRSYARFDLRVTSEGKVYVIEPNVNPCISAEDEMARSARKAGIPYPKLIQMIVHQAIQKNKKTKNPWM